MRRLALALLPLALLPLACDDAGGGSSGGTTVCVGEGCSGNGGGFVPTDTAGGYGFQADTTSAFGGKDGGAVADTGGGTSEDATGGGPDIPVWNPDVWPGGDGGGATVDGAGAADIAQAGDGGGADAGPSILESCSQIIACTSGCDPTDATCHTACDMKATADAKQALASYEQCAADKCGTLSGGEYGTCMLAQCLDVTAACWTGGSASCADTVDCSIACLGAMLPELCLQDCAKGTSAEQFKAFAKYTQCLDDACQTEGLLCGGAATFLCHDTAATCGLYQGSDDCGEAIDCLGKCATPECVIGCQRGASEGAGKKASAFLGCVIDECGEGGTAKCAEDAAKGACSSQAFGCFF